MKRGIGIALLLLAACGGAPTEPAPEPEPERSSGEETTAAPNDGVAITGLMGTISADEVTRGMEPRMNRFLRCFAGRYDTVEVLGGSITFSFRIRVDGSVLWVYPAESTIGDRETERCLLEAASGTRFPRPHGGEAEFQYPLTLDPPEDVRPATNMASSQVSDRVDANRGSLSCGAGNFRVTAYVAPGGEVMAAGVATDSLEASEHLDCVAEAVSSWTLADPGSYPAKVTFSL